MIQKIFAASLVLVLPYLLPAQTNCFNLLYQKGISAVENRQFSTALQKFKAAYRCPDKPKTTDLEERIQRAERHLKEQKAWNRTRRMDSQEAYEGYLADYPKGYYRRRANEALAYLKTLAEKPVKETLPSGTINWTQAYVEASGECVINLEKWPNEAQAIAMAKRGAEIVAKANLLETTAGVHVQRTTSVRDLMAESDLIETHITGMVKGTRIIGEPVIANGIVTITVRMPVFGTDGVAQILFPPPVAEQEEIPEETPDSIREDWVFRLPADIGQLSLFPSFADENGTVLLDGASFTQRFSDLPLVRYARSAEVPEGLRIIDLAANQQGNWVLPASAVASFQEWQKVREQGGGAGPIRVILGG